MVDIKSTLRILYFIIPKIIPKIFVFALAFKDI